MTTDKTAPDIVRIFLAVVAIASLICASIWILLPFLTALIWATMIVATTWPLMLSVQKGLGNRRGPAVAVMTLSMMLLLIVPLSFAIISIINNAEEIMIWARSLTSQPLPLPPEWVERLPLVGKKVAAQWQHYATVGREELSGRVAPYVTKVISWLLAQAGSGMLMVVQFLLTVIISAVLYATGDTAASGVRMFALRLGGPNGENAVILAAKAVRGVALGVVVTALVQATIGGIGLAISGVPAAVLLTAVMFILCVAQIGPALVMIPATVWLFWQDQTMWGSIMIGFTLVAATVDNVIRPFLIKKGADLPLLLIFAGVLGGLVAFGVIGLFIGPVVLAVTYTLLEEWVTRSAPDKGAEAAQDEASENLAEYS